MNCFLLLFFMYTNNGSRMNELKLSKSLSKCTNQSFGEKPVVVSILIKPSHPKPSYRNFAKLAAVSSISSTIICMPNMIPQIQQTFQNIKNKT